MSIKEVNSGISNLPLIPYDYFSEGGIPSDTIIHIFHQFANMSDCASLACANRNMARIFKMDSLWEGLFKCHFPNQNRLPWKAPLQQFEDLFYRIDRNLMARKFTETNFDMYPSEQIFLSKDNKLIFCISSGSIKLLERNNKNGKYDEIQTINKNIVQNSFVLKGDRIFIQEIINDECFLTIMEHSHQTGLFEEIQTIQTKKKAWGCIKDDLLFFGSPKMITVFKLDEKTNKFIKSESLENDIDNHCLYIEGNFLCTCHDYPGQCDEVWFKEGEVHKKFLNLRAKGMNYGRIRAENDLICVNSVFRGSQTAHIWKGRTQVQTLKRKNVEHINGDFIITNDTCSPLTIWKKNESGKFIAIETMPDVPGKGWYDPQLSGDYLSAIENENYLTKYVKIWKKTKTDRFKEVFSMLCEECPASFKDGSLFSLLYESFPRTTRLKIRDFTGEPSPTISMSPIQVPRDPQATAHLSVECDVGYGNSLLLCGQGGGLSWDPSQGKALQCQSASNWTISLPSNVEKFKLVLKTKEGSFKWELEDNRSLNNENPLVIKNIRF